MRGKRWITTLIVAAVILICAGTVYAEIVASGDSGECNWSIDSDGLLVIEPQNGVSGVLGGWSSGHTPWYEKKLQIKSVQFKGTVRVVGNNNPSMFMSCNNLTNVDLSGLDTSEATDISAMFSNCYSLKTLDLSVIDTKNVNFMHYMFQECRDLVSVNLAGLDTSSVIDMHGFFWGCRSLTSIDLSDFNTFSVKFMMNMFLDCTSLQRIVVGDSWKTDNVSVQSSASMFNGCTNLVGGNGTVFDPNHTDKEYARVDNPPDAPGYLTHVKKWPHPIKVTIEGGGSASAAPETGTMDTEVTLTADPDTGWHFKEWDVVSGGITIDENNKFTIGNKDVEVKAVFEKCSSVCEETKEVKATCTKDGTKAYWTCKTCGKMYSDKDCTTVITKPEVLSKGHLMVKTDEVKATCEKDGTKAYWRCKNCKKLFSDKDGKTEITKPEVIIKTGHSWGEWKTTKEPTETATGVKQRVCRNDSAHVEKETIPVKKAEPKPAPETEAAEKTEVKNVSGIPLAKMTAKGKKSLKITWVKVNGAEGYDIFFAACGKNEKKTKCKLVKTITANKKLSWTKTKLKAKKAYKAYVKAFVMENGKKRYVGTSPTVHAFTANGTKTQTNAKSVTVKKTSISVKKGKTKQINANVKKVKSKLALMDKTHAAKLRYLSTNRKIASVNKSGKIKGVSKGSCYVYVYAHNGVSKRIKVKVN